MRLIAIIVSLSFAVPAAVGYRYLFRDDLRPAAGFGGDRDAEDRMLLECYLVGACVAAFTGRGFYRLVGRAEEAAILKRELGHFIIYLEFAGALLFMYALADRIGRRQVDIRDALTLAMIVVLAVAAVIDWRRR